MIRFDLRFLIFASAILATCLPIRAEAQVVFTAQDGDVTSLSNAPNSLAEDASWNTAASAIGTVSNITFSNSTVRSASYALLTSDSGNATVTDINPTTNSHTLGLYLNNDANGADISSYDAVAYGYATPGSANFLQEASLVSGSTNYINFMFASPVDAFGAYFSGCQSQASTETIYYNDGATSVLTIPAANTVGGLAFAGFTYAGESITSVQIKEVNAANTIDHFGVSGIEIANVVVTPEPSSIVTLIIGAALLIAFVGFGRRRTVAA
jgi:hypothetical protein